VETAMQQKVRMEGRVGGKVGWRFAGMRCAVRGARQSEVGWAAIWIWERLSIAKRRFADRH
jgi:hypothetical protein